MKHLMTDLETLDTSDTAAVIQVGLVVFDDDGNLLGDLCVNINAIDSLLNGFTTNVDTCKNFWAKQPKEVKQSVLYPAEQYSCREAARLIDKFLKSQFEDKFTIWSNHLLFDIPKLNLLLTKMGFKSLTDRTPHYLVEDFASVKNTCKRLYPDEFQAAKDKLSNDMAHNAVADCYYQISLLHSCYEIMGDRIKIPTDFLKQPPQEPLCGVQATPKELVDEGLLTEPVIAEPGPEVAPDDPLLNPPMMEDDLESWEDDEVVNSQDPFLTEVYNPKG